MTSFTCIHTNDVYQQYKENICNRAFKCGSELPEYVALILRNGGSQSPDRWLRELRNNQTGAIKFEIKPICVYSVTGKTRVNDTGEETFGLLCFAEITEFAKELHSEMEKVVLMNELPENWTYPLIQPKLIEKYLQIEKQSYSRIQMVAKQTIEYIKKIIKPGMNLLEIRKFCEEKLLELGADSFWYWDVGAFVFAGDETTVSVSGKQYVTSNRVIGNNDIITIDLSPQMGNIW